MDVYSLGIEFSTQSVKMVVLDLNSTRVIYTASFEYDKTFPEYKTDGGVLVSESPEIRHTSPFMLLEALDHAFNMLKNDGIDLSLIKAVKTDGMQHCTVYTDETFARIQALNPETGLLVHLRSSITRKSSPVWEDRSPVKEADYLTSSLKDKGGIINITGNRSELRFPASQILKWAVNYPGEYKKTSHIFILSAFITSILAGKIAPVDTGDGWGTNLNDLNIDNPGWCDDVLNVADSYLDNLVLDSTLRDKIGEIDHYDAEVGRISRYFVERYGMNSEAIVLAGTGDNPATLLGCGGYMVVSLGSSYTVNGVMRKIVPSTTGEYNVFGYTRGSVMALSVFTNGGKVHEHFLRRYIVGYDDRELKMEDWESYTLASGESLLSGNEKLMLPYLLDESVPLRKRGIVRDEFGDDDMNVNIRALHISQVLSLKLHSNHLSDVDTLCVVGGGVRNRFLRQLISDIFNAITFAINSADFAAPFGCAVSGARKLLSITYEEAAERFVLKDESSYLEPIKENIPRVKTLLDRYSELENRK